MRAVRLSHGLDLGLVVLACALLPACGGQGDAGSEAAAASEGTPALTAAATENAAAMELDTSGAPACSWRGSGEELAGRASPPDSASARLGDGVVKVCYSAPSARGRRIFGGLVPYGEPWRLGANEATTIHVTVPAEIGGVRVEPGSYSLYAIPGESEWTIVVNRAANRWGIPIDDNVRAQDVGSFTVTPTQTDHVERLSIQVEPADEGAAQMVIAWEMTRLAFPVRPAGG